MNIITMISKFSSCMILTMVAIYIWSKLLDKKIDFKRHSFYIIYFSIVLTSLLTYYFMNDFVKMVIVVTVFIFSVKKLFNSTTKDAILVSIFYEFIVVISECLFALAINIFLGMDSSEIVETQFATFTANIMIAAISIIIINLKISKKIYNICEKSIKKFNEMHIIVASFCVVIAINILEATIYYKVDFRYLLVFNTLLIAFCFFIIFSLFKNKMNYINIYNKYNTSLNSLKEYEYILDKYRVSSHENKNQLYTIRNMLPKSDRKVISYIDTLVENKLKDDEKVMFEIAPIPDGGLKGLIYSKVLMMKDLKIDYELEISKEIHAVDMINSIDDSLMLDICKIIGVYLDNAIQEVSTLNEKYINIEMYIEDNNLFISISNNYSGFIDIDKIDEKGYTTKEKGHGYGLFLSKELISKNKRLSNSKKISKDTFTQILKVEMLNNN